MFRALLEFLVSNDACVQNCFLVLLFLLMCSSALIWYLTTLVLSLAIALNLPMAPHFGSDSKYHTAVVIAGSTQMLSFNQFALQMWKRPFNVRLSRGYWHNFWPSKAFRWNCFSTLSYHTFSVALVFAYVSFKCIESTFSNPDKYNFILRPHRPTPNSTCTKFNLQPARLHTHNSAGSRMRHANACTRNPRGLNRPTHDAYGHAKACWVSLKTDEALPSLSWGLTCYLCIPSARLMVNASFFLFYSTIFVIKITINIF